MNRLLPPPPSRERGQTVVLAAITVPVVIVTAGLGIGAAMVRTAHGEVQRTSDLGALAAATYEPMLGRPTASGVPTVPSSLGTALPPLASAASPASYAAGSEYAALYNAGTASDHAIGDQLGIGPLTQPSLGSTWTEGCTVAEAQFDSGRAHLSRNYAAEHDALGNPVTPHCAGASGFNDGSATGAEHVYLSPEMDSTGAYRLQRCMVQPADCATLLGSSETSTLAAMGGAFSSQVASALGVSPAPGCLVDPTAAGCYLDSNVSKSLLGTTSAQAVQTALRSQLSSVTGIPYNQLPLVRSDLVTLAGLVFGTTTPASACPTALGPASGQTVCGFGVNLASLLPSTMAPRVRAVVHHSLSFPFVPRWLHGATGPGNFDFTSEALARRTFKNAIVVPSVPADFTTVFGSDTSACLRGRALLHTATGSLGYLLGGSLSALDTALSPLVAPISGGTSTCANAQVDGAAPPATGFTLDLNPTLAAGQTALVDAASALNGVADQAVNGVIGASLGKDATRDCQQSPPAAWCVNVADQAIRDMQDVYNPPGGGSAPTAADVVERSYQGGEPIAVVSLGKWVTVPLGTTATSPAGPVSAVTYWIPALDVVPATVAYWDRNHPEKTRFNVADTPQSVRGLYKAVLIDANSTVPLCAVSHDPTNRCIDQPPA